MDKQEEIRIKNQKAEEAMRRARQAQQANEKMQRELKAAARELARHQELTRKASMQDHTDYGVAGSNPNVRGAERNRVDAALKQQEASKEAARQAMIYEAAKRRAEKKEAAKKAAELVAAQRAAEKKVHHTSPETKELQKILLQQIADIMDEDGAEEVSINRNPSEAQGQKPKKSNSNDLSNGKNQKTKKEKNTLEEKDRELETDKDMEAVPAMEDFGDLVIMDVHGAELQPESSAALEKKSELERMKEEAKTALETDPEAKLETWGRMGAWFQTFCWMHIPIIGFWYMAVVAVRKKTPKEKKAFARAYILYKILVFILAGTILYICYRVGLDFVEQILSYMEAHQ